MAVTSCVSRAFGDTKTPAVIPDRAEKCRMPSAVLHRRNNRLSKIMTHFQSDVTYLAKCKILYHAITSCAKMLPFAGLVLI